jgi:anthranilate synthase/aminodeoxychorismate synthase-like glutamine amidotransferase
MILLIDNYDSFVFNLARYFQRLGQSTHVVRNDAIDVPAIRALGPRAIVLSPGPCAPEQAGCSVDIVRQLHSEFPMLGVCLGHQAIAAALGGDVVRAAEPVHGSSSEVFHDGAGIFQGLPSPMNACRYHSLVVREASLPECLEVSARTIDGVVMGLRHKQLPVVGVQFHPESILTEFGYELLAGFLRLAALDAPAAPSTRFAELVPVVPQPLPVAARPVPFTPPSAV